MTPDPAPQPSSTVATAAEIRILLSADDTGRIPFPEGTHRAIAIFLQALTHLTEQGHVERSLRDGFLGCFLTKSGRRLRDQVATSSIENSPVGAPMTPESRRPEYQALSVLGAALLLWTAAPVQARLGETPERIEARYGAPVKVENGLSARDFQCTYRHDGITIVVHFLDEKSQDECFANESGDPIPTDEVQRLLEINQRGGKWNLKQDNGSEKKWNLNSGDAIAVHDYKTGHWLEIKTIWWQHFIDQHPSEPEKGVSDRLKDF